MKKQNDNWMRDHGGPHKWGVSVYLRPGETEEHLIKRFEKKVQKSGLLREYREKTFFEKPSAKRKQKEFKAKVKERKRILEEKRGYGSTFS